MISVGHATLSLFFFPLPTANGSTPDRHVTYSPTSAEGSGGMTAPSPSRHPSELLMHMRCFRVGLKTVIPF
ncbi:hypothetical protein CEXT_67941 [Caerostris extrusa]|uniref:Secreted protein n=1 Tax=Caerostris extrusa TaxID=172846 RepID=A0AAV4VS10_CAEEX|nr:hypothetical protein CEXT_67941 [Caerostris extrusa]